MSDSKRGRPRKDISTVVVSNLIVEFLSKKTNDYGADVCYMKIIDKDGKQKMKPITSLASEGINMPYWKTDQNSLILKVKEKFLCAFEGCEKGKTYVIDAEFESYCIDRKNEEPLKGYYLKVPSMKPCNIIVEVKEESD